MPEVTDDHAHSGPRRPGGQDRGEKGDTQRWSDDGDRATEESAREGEMFGRAVVAPDLELPISTFLQHRCCDMVELSLLPRTASRVEVVVGIRPRGVCRDGQDDRLIGHGSSRSRCMLNRQDCVTPAVSCRHPAWMKAGEGMLPQSDDRSVPARP